ncbi:MAG: hypothetical protein PHG97_02370 [Candidatus Margulisbacteria bacterium]|nr:hypothetical protein [Candidatus Margulisiibacteriota bacterium]
MEARSIYRIAQRALVRLAKPALVLAIAACGSPAKSEVVIPLDRTRNMGLLADYTLKVKCDLSPNDAQIFTYRNELNKKGYNENIDILRQDVRWWPKKMQEWTGTVVLSTNDLPSCPDRMETPAIAQSSALASASAAAPQPPVAASSAPPLASTPTKQPPRPVGCPKNQEMYKGHCIPK